MKQNILNYYFKNLKKNIKREKREKMAKNYDLYISYNWSEFNQVKIICDLLKESEFNIWFDDSETVNDLNEFEKNIHALQTSLVFIYFPSREYNKCIKNKIEYTTAFEQNMKMISLDLNAHPTTSTTNSNSLNSTQFKINNSMIKNYSKSNELNLIINFIKMECNLSYSFGYLIRKNNDIDWFKTYFSFKRRESRASSKGSLFYTYLNNNNNNRPLSRNKSMYITNKNI